MKIQQSRVEKYRNLLDGEGECVSPMCGIQTHDVVGTDCTGSCKSNYDTITIEHDAPHKQLENLNFATYIYVLY